MKRLFTGLTAVFLAVILVFSVPVHALSAHSAVLLDCATDRLLYERFSDERSLIASTTKIMTALIICEQCNVLDRMRIPKEAVGVEGSSIYLQEGEILTIQELLYGMMLHSGNDAAVALALYCGGTVEGFAQLMNDKARELGLQDSHFENPHGLDSPQHYSSAKDLAILSAAAMENAVFSQIVSTKTIRVGERSLRNHNKLLWQLEGADGVKTGYTKAAGRILVSSACRDGRRLVAVTIDAPDDWNDHKNLIESGFSQYRIYQIVEEGQILGRVELAGGTESYVELIAKDSFFYPLAMDESPAIRLPDPGFVYAPVCEGQEAGFANFYLGERCIGNVSLQYGSTIERIVEPKTGFWSNLFGGKHT